MSRPPAADSRVRPGVRAVALAMALGSALLVVVGLVFFALYVTTPLPETLGWKLTTAFGIGVLAFAAAGAVIAATTPANRVAWLLLIVGLVGGIIFALQRAGVYLEFVRGAPVGNLLLTLSSALAAPNSAVVMILIPLLFPDGRLPSRRLRPVVWLYVVGTSLVLIGSLGIDQIIMLGLPNAYLIASPALAAAYAMGIALYLVGTVAAVASLIHRSRHAEPTTRLQIRCLFYAAAIFGLVIMGVLAVFGLTPDATVLALVSAAHSLIPLAVAVAVLRYRLYDIDLLIHRTLVYGLTTGTIAVAFFAGIVLLQTLLRPFTTGSELAVAASTLASVALFQPFRRRIQAAVDRRFFRSRYDSVRTLDAFAEQLRDEVDLEAVRVHLLGAVGQTMSPAHASVWLRDPVR